MKTRVTFKYFVNDCRSDASQSKRQEENSIGISFQEDCEPDILKIQVN